MVGVHWFDAVLLLLMMIGAALVVWAVVVAVNRGRRS